MFPYSEHEAAAATTASSAASERRRCPEPTLLLSAPHTLAACFPSSDNATQLSAFGLVEKGSKPCLRIKRSLQSHFGIREATTPTPQQLHHLRATFARPAALNRFSRPTARVPAPPRERCVPRGGLAFCYSMRELSIERQVAREDQSDAPVGPSSGARVEAVRSGVGEERGGGGRPRPRFRARLAAPVSRGSAGGCLGPPAAKRSHRPREVAGSGRPPAAPRSVPLSRARCAGVVRSRLRGRARRSGGGRAETQRAVRPCSQERCRPQRAPVWARGAALPARRRAAAWAVSALLASGRKRAGCGRARGSEVRTDVWLTDRNGEKARRRQREARVGLPQALPPPPSAPEIRRQSLEPQASAGRAGLVSFSFILSCKELPCFRDGLFL